MELDITLLVSFLAFFAMVTSWVLLPTNRPEAEAVSQLRPAPSTSEV